MNILEKLSLIQQEIKVNKSQYNSFGKYNYRSSEDVLEAIKPMQEKYKVAFCSSEELVQVGDYLAIKSLAKMLDCESDQSVFAVAYAIVDFDAKGMQMPQRTGSASSYAKKYAYGNLLLLDDTKDADASNTHEKAIKEGSKQSSNKTNGMTTQQFNAAVKAYNNAPDDASRKIIIERVGSYLLTEDQVKEFFNQTKVNL